MTFRMGDIFPATDPVARWLVTLAIALTELIWADSKMRQAWEVERAKAADDPPSLDQIQYFRLICLQVWEIAKFLQESYDQWPDIKAFVHALPEQAGDHRAALLEAVADDALLGGIRVELVMARDLRAHYLGLHKKGRDPVTLGMAAIADNDVTVVSSSEVSELWPRSARPRPSVPPSVPPPGNPDASMLSRAAQISGGVGRSGGRSARLMQRRASLVVLPAARSRS